MNDSRQRQPFPLLGSMLWLGIMWAVGSAGTAAILLRLDRPDQLTAALAAAAICAGAACLALVPIALLEPRSPDGIVNGAMAGMLSRLIISLGGAGMLVLTTTQTPQAAGGWTIVWYLVFLFTEVWLLCRHLHRHDRRVSESAAC